MGPGAARNTPVVALQRTIALYSPARALGSENRKFQERSPPMRSLLRAVWALFFVKLLGWRLSFLVYYNIKV